MEDAVSIGYLVAIGGTLIVGLLGALWGLLSLMFRQFENTISKKFAELEEDAKALKELEREFLMFQRDLPLLYVRREDYVRNQSVLEAKFDGLVLKLENWQLKEVARNER